MIVDLRTGEELFASHPDNVRPIASITKLMTVIVALDAHQPLDELLAIDISQTPEMRGVYSRVRLNSKISRRNLMLLALMSSENRAAATLAHHYPGGYTAFIRAMNTKAQQLGMHHTHYQEPTGLSEKNVSTARDLVILLEATTHYPLISQLSVTPETSVHFSHPDYTLSFRNTNHLIYRADWQIQLTKTGYTDEAGHCLVMRTVINQHPVALVVMDAFGKYTHFADARRLRSWIETGKVSAVPAEALEYKASKRKNELSADRD
ncbi:MAG: D-alanyl-D-alanine endopeptidase [Candidatus Erwinia impunctatus]|nr:D-alanyl-D-alanine endopeptidase [Culicoides impunctatus]